MTSGLQTEWAYFPRGS